MKQLPLAMADQDGRFERYSRCTKREDFLDAVSAVVPWAALCAVIGPHYPKAGNGWRSIGLEGMLTVHLLHLRCSGATYLWVGDKKVSSALA